ncbi:hypothetical protein NX059_011334 [Plenodomus lindquistii]|nr:hypothetical protein NX059_011334 [Plenodomus lindquistii]
MQRSPHPLTERYVKQTKQHNSDVSAKKKGFEQANSQEDTVAIEQLALLRGKLDDLEAMRREDLGFDLVTAEDYEREAREIGKNLICAYGDGSDEMSEDEAEDATTLPIRSAGK